MELAKILSTVTLSDWLLWKGYLTRAVEFLPHPDRLVVITLCIPLSLWRLVSYLLWKSSDSVVKERLWIASTVTLVANPVWVAKDRLV